MKKISKEEYSQMVKKATPPSPILKNSLMAFLFGGSICLLGEIIFKLTANFGMEEADGRAVVSLCLIFLAATLTSVGVFDKIGKIAGAGTLVPITGFANSMVSPAMEFKSEGFITGLGVKLFTVAGPVIAYGTAASVVYGFIYWIVRLL